MERNDNTGFESALPKPFARKALLIMLGGAAGALVIAAELLSVL